MVRFCMSSMEPFGIRLASPICLKNETGSHGVRRARIKFFSLAGEGRKQEAKSNESNRILLLSVLSHGYFGVPVVPVLKNIEHKKE